MALVRTAVVLGMACVLVWAGLEKARRPGPAAATLNQLGLPGHLATRAAWLLIFAELAVALGLIFRAAWPAPLVGAAMLSGGFALAGLIALRGEEPIRCNCLGPGGRGYLGRSQLVALPLWWTGVALLWFERPAAHSLPEGAAAFAVVGLTLASVRGVSVLSAWREARADRRSAQEMYAWLR